MTNKPIAIIGAGNGGQAFAAWLSLKGFKTRIFDVVPATVDALNAKGGVEICGNASLTGFGKIEFASTDMGKVMEGAELVMVVLPSIYHKSIATEMAKHLVDGQYVMLNPNASLGAVEFRKTLNDCGCKADITLAEPHALVGFAGRRVIEQTTHEQIAHDLQQAENVLRHGFIDQIVPRDQQRATLVKLLEIGGCADDE